MTVWQCVLHLCVKIWLPDALLGLVVLALLVRGYLQIYGFSYGFPWVDGAGHEISAEVPNIFAVAMPLRCMNMYKPC